MTARVLSEKTGVPRGTLLAWERRYGLPAPRRLANGHRTYTARDVDAILQARALIAGGSRVRDALESAYGRRKGSALPTEPYDSGRVLTELVDACPLFLQVIEARSLTWQFANRAVASAYGVTSVNGARVIDHWPEADTCGFLEHIRQVAASGEEFFWQAARVYHRGRENYYNFYFRRLFGSPPDTLVAVIGSNVSEEARRSLEMAELLANWHTMFDRSEMRQRFLTAVDRASKYLQLPAVERLKLLPSLFLDCVGADVAVTYCGKKGILYRLAIVASEDTDTAGAIGVEDWVVAETALETDRPQVVRRLSGRTWPLGGTNGALVVPTAIPPWQSVVVLAWKNDFELTEEELAHIDMLRRLVIARPAGAPIIPLLEIPAQTAS